MNTTLKNNISNIENDLFIVENENRNLIDNCENLKHENQELKSKVVSMVIIIYFL